MSDQHQSSLIVASNMSSSYLIKVLNRTSFPRKKTKTNLIKFFQIVLVYALASSASALTDDTPVDLPAPSPNTSPQSGFYQYVNVPSPFEYEFGFNVGNSNHYVSRFEQFKNTAFRTMVTSSRAFIQYNDALRNCAGEVV